ncbi:glycosyltransferase [Occallatibacter riparius]|uniref:Glycosyltransferase n=1 Tax=Occallatibacter riparius TaxID=1002689 RepID=A0A9J7BJP0_9BACT|nr:glycosyltransferase [Occallatibacter riparius]UWZ83040.1 glycosyltransferase [Occallatibacter riparius]
MRLEEKLALVIPTLNEAECLPAMLERVLAVMAALPVAFEILVVDDDSPDATAAVVAAIAEREPRVRLLVRRGERGLAGAILHGWQNTDASLLGVMDADMQHPPEVLRELVNAMEAGADVALASRFAALGAGHRWRNPLRRLATAVSIWMARPLQPAEFRVSDPLSGYFLVRRRCVAGVAFRQTGFKLLLEILTRGRLRSVVEVPFEFGRRGGGRSKAGARVAWDYVLLLCRLYQEKWKAMVGAPESSAE